MKRILLLLFVPVLAIAAPTDVSSKISAVTVYADRARVTRSADAQVAAGENVVRFVGLPMALDESSIQVTGKSATDGVQVLGVEIRSKYLEQTMNERVRDLEAQLLAIEDSVAEIDSRRNDARERKEFLNRMRESLARGQGKDAAATSTQELVSLYEFYGSSLDAIGKEIRGFDIAERDLQPRKRVLEEELARLRGGAQSSEKEVLVAIRSQKPAQVGLSLSYNMLNASWTPLYDARVDTSSAIIDMSYLGIVRQQTGESWQNVKLSLSTARPNVGARMPELEPWWMRFATAAREPASLQLQSEMSAQNSISRDQQYAKNWKIAPLFEAKAVDAEIRNGGISAVFEIPVAASIPSDGEPHQVAITAQKFDGKLEYITTPKLAQAAYLKARVTNDGDAPILGGQVNLFRDGDYVGKGELRFIAQGADFDFFLGVDDGLKVVRKTLVDKSSESGFLQKRKGVTKKYEMTFDNFTGKTVKLTVLDQLPVSQDENIVVSNPRFSHAPVEQNKDTGLLKWEVSIAPNGRHVLTEEFSVEWPFGQEVAGM